MKKVVMLSAAAILGISSIAVSQAAEDTAQQSAEATGVATATEEATAEQTASEDASASSEQENAQAEKVEENAEASAEEEEKPKTPQLPEHVQKLINLYPNLVSRIHPYGLVCYEDQDCDVMVMSTSAGAGDGPRDGKSVYNMICKTCHASGLLGSPKLGDASAWGPRAAQGMDTLYTHAINGFNAMPARGGADIPDEEVINAVDYMVAESK